MPEIPSIRAALKHIKVRFPELMSDSQEAPLFVLSAGTCSGSRELVQRLSDNCFFWDEPLGEACVIPRLAETLSYYNREGATTETPPTPSIRNLLDAHCAWFEALLTAPARSAGHDRWGLSEHRLSVDHCRYLQWLFPRAKFLCLIRNPFDAWREYAAQRARSGTGFHRWPDQPLTVHRFARQWNALARSFVDQHDDVGGLLIRYESLNDESVRRNLGEYLEFDPASPENGTGPNDDRKPAATISPLDLHVLHTECGETATQLGYEYPIRTAQGTTSTARFKPNTRSQCVILVPVGSHVVPRCEQSLKELERRGYVVRRVYGYAAIDQGRNQMVTDALNEGFEETMWIDSDIGFDPSDVDKLRRHKLPIVCGVYPQKGKRALACHVMPGTKKLTFGNEGGLIELLYAPTGFLHIRREVYERVKNHLGLPTCNERFKKTMEPFFQPLIRKDGEGYWYLAEDFAFCHRAREAGIKIMADTTIRLWHIGNYAYSWEDAGMERRRFGTFHYHLSDGSPADRAGAAEIEVDEEALGELRDSHRWPEAPPDVEPEPALGWLSDKTREILLKHVPADARLIVELGSWLGLSARFLLDHAPHATLVAVDRWTPLDRHREMPDIQHVLPRLYETFLRNNWDYRDRLVPVRSDTLDGLRELANRKIEPNVIYVDADHSYEAVRAELQFIQKHFPRTIVVGDDFNWDGVGRAVREFAQTYRKQVITNGVGWRLK